MLVAGVPPPNTQTPALAQRQDLLGARARQPSPEPMLTGDDGGVQGILVLVQKQVVLEFGAHEQVFLVLLRLAGRAPFAFRGPIEAPGLFPLPAPLHTGRSRQADIYTLLRGPFTVPPLKTEPKRKPGLYTAPSPGNPAKPSEGSTMDTAETAARKHSFLASVPTTQDTKCHWHTRLHVQDPWC